MLKLSRFTSIVVAFMSIIIIVMCAYFKTITEGLTNNTVKHKFVSYLDKKTGMEY